MSHIKRILQNFTTFFMAIVLTALPYMGVALPVLDVKAEECRLNVTMISDTHLETHEPFRQMFLAWGLSGLRHGRTQPDLVLIDGDLTNYGDVSSIQTYYNITQKYSPVPVLTIYGNHDIGHVEDRPHDEVRADLIARANDAMGLQSDSIYYKYEMNGYTFIVLGDEGERWDALTLSDAQMAFLDTSLAEATADGKPAFVCCHWPLEGTHGDAITWPDSGLERDRFDIQSILEKYTNVFYISGHMHAGIKSHAVEEKYGLSSAEVHNGVTYLNLPTFGILNWFGSPCSGSGAQLEVYDDQVIFRPRNYLTGHWFVNSEYSFDLV